MLSRLIDEYPIYSSSIDTDFRTRGEKRPLPPRTPPTPSPERIEKAARGLPGKPIAKPPPPPKRAKLYKPKR